MLIKNAKESTKIVLEIITTFVESADYQVKIWKSILFQYNSIKQLQSLKRNHSK